MITHNQNNGLCFDVKDLGTENFTPIQLVTCRDDWLDIKTAQRFDIDSQGRIRSFLNPTKCIEAGKAGTLYKKLYLYDCHKGDWQQWLYHTDGRIKNNYHGKYIGPAYCSVKDGTPLELQYYDYGACGEAQKWKISW